MSGDSQNDQRPGLSATRRQFVKTAGAGALGLAMGGGVVPAAAQPARARRLKVPRLISFWGQAGNPQHYQGGREFTWVNPRFDYRRFVDKYLKREADWFLNQGLKPRIQLHNPFGVRTKSGGGIIMDLDGYVHAKETQEMAWLTGSFVDAIQEFIETYHAEVIAYAGGFHKDFDRYMPGVWVDGFTKGRWGIKRSLTIDDRGRTVKTYTYKNGAVDQMVIDPQVADQFIWRCWASVAPFLEAGCTLAFDAIADNKEHSPSIQFLQLLHSMGLPVWIEAAPPKSALYMHKYFNIQITSVGYYRWFVKGSNPGNMVAINEVANPDLEYAIIYSVFPKGSGVDKKNTASLVRYTQDLSTKGYSVIFGVSRFIKEGVKYADLFD